MTTFEHRRYPALTLQDEKGIWAQFTEETREFGEHKVRVGVLTTDDDELIGRLRAATDPDLHEVGGDDTRGRAPADTPTGLELPPGLSVAATEAWVKEGGARAVERAKVALAAETAPGGFERGTLLDRLQKIIDAAE